MNDRATILAVDDTPESLALLVTILTSAGYRVRPADSGELALAAVAANPPDLVLLDLRMRGLHGLEVCRRLKAGDETRHIPIILISAFADEAEWLEGLRLGAADYITKPFKSGELLARVKTHVSLGRAKVAAEQQAAALRVANERVQAANVERQKVEDDLGQNLDRADRSRRALLSALEDQERAEASRNMATARLRRFFDANIIGMVVGDAAGAVIEANDYFLRLIGFTREEFERGEVNWRGLTPPEWLPADEQAIRELAERGTCTPYEKEYVRRDGTRVPVYLADAVLPGPGGQIAAFALDITERRRAEAQAAQRALAQEAIADLGRLALSGVELSVLLDRAVQITAQVLDVALSAVLELSPDRSSLLLRAGVGWQEGLVGSLVVGSGPDSLAGFTLQSKVPVVVEELRTEQRFRVPATLVDHGVASSLSTVIGDSERPYGSLAAHATQHVMFSQNDVSFLQGVANVLANAVQRDAHEAEIHRMNRLFGTLSEVNQAIVRCTSSDELYLALCRVAVRQGGFSAAWVGLKTGDGAQVTVVARDAVEPGTLRALPDQTQVCGIVAEALHTGLPCVANDARQDQRSVACAVVSEAGIQSCAAFPFRVGGEVVGAFAVSSVDPAFFNVDEIGLLDEVAQDVSYALEHLGQEARRAKAEVALRDSEERYRELVENLNDVIFTVDADGILTYISSPVRMLTGYAPEEVVGLPFADLVYPDDLPGLNARFRDIREDRLEPWEFRYRTRDGETRWARTSSRPIVEG
jgi:PAS domain S-box-containing protein